MPISLRNACSLSMAVQHGWAVGKSPLFGQAAWQPAMRQFSSDTFSAYWSAPCMCWHRGVGGDLGHLDQLIPRQCYAVRTGVPEAE